MKCQCIGEYRFRYIDSRSFAILRICKFKYIKVKTRNHSIIRVVLCLYMLIYILWSNSTLCLDTAR
jgi:hypothetical protein